MAFYEKVVENAINQIEFKPSTVRGVLKEIYSSYYLFIILWLISTLIAFFINKTKISKYRITYKVEFTYNIPSIVYQNNSIHDYLERNLNLNRDILLFKTYAIHRTILNEKNPSINIYTINYVIPSIGLFKKLNLVNTIGYNSIIIDSSKYQIVNHKIIFKKDINDSISFTIRKGNYSTYNYRRNEFSEIVLKENITYKFKNSDSIKSDYFSFIFDSSFIQNIFQYNTEGIEIEFIAPENYLDNWLHSVFAEKIDSSTQLINLSIIGSNIEKSKSILFLMLENFKKVKYNSFKQNINREIQTISEFLYSSNILGDSLFQKTIFENQYALWKQNKTNDLLDLSLTNRTSIFDYNILNIEIDKISYEKLNYLRFWAIAVIFYIFYIILRNLLNKRIRGRKDISKMANIPILGTISYLRNGDILENINRIVYEDFQKLKVNLTNRWGNQKVYSVFSSNKGEGKSTIAFNLALTFSLSKKVILLNMDLRKNKSYSFEISIVGTSSYLLGKALIEDIINNSQYSNLDVITSGQVPPNPVELLTSSKAFSLVNALKENYDIVIIDCPPINYFADAKIIRNFSEVSLFVVREHYTLKEELYKGIKELDNNIGNVAIILNDSRDSFNNRFNSYYYNKT